MESNTGATRYIDPTLYSIKEGLEKGEKYLNYASRHLSQSKKILHTNHTKL